MSPMARAEAAGRHHVGRRFEQGLPVLGEPDLVETGRIGVEVHEEVDVTGGSGLTSGDRTEHSHPRRVAPPSSRHDRLAVVPESVDRRVATLGPRPSRAGTASALVRRCWCPLGGEPAGGRREAGRGAALVRCTSGFVVFGRHGTNTRGSGKKPVHGGP